MSAIGRPARHGEALLWIVLAGVVPVLGGCGWFEDQWHDAKACMEERGAVYQGAANFEDDLPADNGIVVDVENAGTGEGWVAHVYFFPDAGAAEDAARRYPGIADPFVYRRGRVFVAWETADERSGVQRPPAAVRGVVDPCLTHQ